MTARRKSMEWASRILWPAYSQYTNTQKQKAPQRQDDRQGVLSFISESC